MGVTTDQETVRLTLKALHPDGVICRSRNRLKRGIYISKGPGYMWHIDGYEKLRRNITCLKVLSSNNDPNDYYKYLHQVHLTISDSTAESTY